MKAVGIFGSQRALAARLGIDPMNVTHWKSRGVPPLRAREIELATGGAVTSEDLCPKYYGQLSPTHSPAEPGA